jgi:aspartate/methionine/tyrosine aminotransferase
MEPIDPLAALINRQISQTAPSLYESLSMLGRQIFFPRGILTQSAEAKQKAFRFNATIGMAMEQDGPMHLPISRRYFGEMSPSEIYTYAPPAGLPNLRQLWKERMIRNNPTLNGKHFSQPVVTSALTHGLSIGADLLIDRDDPVISPDKMWGVYRLNFVTRKGGVMVTYPMFDDRGRFNLDAFAAVLKTEGNKHPKVTIIFNFPNNPTGYTPDKSEAAALVRIVQAQAETGTRLVVFCDDAYFGLFYEDSIKESLFGELCNLHENVVAVKLDGVTKENYAWGFRTGFITIGTRTRDPQQLYEALENKLKGLIRVTVSSCNHVAQTVMEKVLSDPDYNANMASKFQILKQRAVRLKELLRGDRYKDAWDYYPFNSGYFMSLKMRDVDAESVRRHLLEHYGIGTIALGRQDLRIAFSCIEVDYLEELLDTIYQAVSDLKKGSIDYSNA